MRSEAPPTVSLRLDQAFAALRRRWPTALLVVVTWLGIGVVAAHLAPEGYTATSAVTVESFTEAVPETGTAPDMPTEQEAMTSSAVLEHVAVELDTTPARVARAVSVANPEGSRVLTVTYRASTAQRAAHGADAVATGYLDVRRAAAQARARTVASDFQDRLAKVRSQLPKGDREPSVLVSAYGQQISDLQERITDISLVSRASGGHVTERAAVPTSPGGPSTLVYLAGALVLGLACAVVAALLRDRMSRRASDPQLLSARLGAPVVVAARASSADDVLRTLTLRFDLLAGRAPRTVAVVGAPSTGLPAALATQLRRQGLGTRLADAADIGASEVDRGWPEAPTDHVLLVHIAAELDTPLAATIASRCELVVLALTRGAATTRVDSFLALLRAAGRAVDGAVLLDPQHPLCASPDPSSTSR